LWRYIRGASWRNHGIKEWQRYRGAGASKKRPS
jgi:hypothetical protein